MSPGVIGVSGFMQAQDFSGGALFICKSLPYLGSLPSDLFGFSHF